MGKWHGRIWNPPLRWIGKAQGDGKRAEPLRPSLRSATSPLREEAFSRAKPAQKGAPLCGELAEPARPEGLCPFAAALYKKLCAVPLDIPRSGVILVKYANEQLDSEQFET